MNAIPKKGNIKTAEFRDVIHGSISLYPWELAIVDSPIFQRLRNIKQLGFSEFAYPCAVHNRYIHSIGACHLAGLFFQSCFKEHFFSSQEHYHHYYYLVRACALMHDLGHGPFSHAIEMAMPSLESLKMPGEVSKPREKRQASHEDYTLKIILDSPLTKILEKSYGRFGITPQHIAAVMNLDIKEKDSFFVDRGVNFRKIFHQVISSEIDADRMDYLQRDSYYTGVSYGKFDSSWLLTNLSLHVANKTAHLALNERALFTFEDFLLSRYHMFMMVYLHHKSVCYEKMMERYLKSPGCSFSVPSDVVAYSQCDDSTFYESMRKDAMNGNAWATRILLRKPYPVVLEVYDLKKDPQKYRDAVTIKNRLTAGGIDFFEASSGKGLSNYIRPNLGAYSSADETTIFIESVSRVTQEKSFRKIEQLTDLFRKYAEEKNIYRIFAEQMPK